ncbi:hypothetical protein FQN54_003489 [Arachnomyces sp. PD_36]|nr:hypothetical protein FQN54_003489 [Arachnomyces sp. PD_36]
MDSLFASTRHRYGEPGWTVRPKDDHFSTPEGAQFIFPRGEFSYEELEVEDRLKMSFGIHQIAAPMATNSEPENPLHILSGDGEIVDVVVGRTASLWRIHKRILLLHSEYFRRALTGPSADPNSNKVVLSEDDNEIFTLFVQWLYSQTFTSSSIPDLLRAHVLGDKLGTPKFRQQVLEKLYGLNLPSPQITVEQALWVADNTLPSSMLRSFTMDTIALEILNRGPDNSAQELERLSPITVEVLQSMSSIAKSSINGWAPKHVSSYVEQ